MAWTIRLPAARLWRCGYSSRRSDRLQAAASAGKSGAHPSTPSLSACSHRSPGAIRGRCPGIHSRRRASCRPRTVASCRLGSPRWTPRGGPRPPGSARRSPRSCLPARLSISSRPILLTRSATSSATASTENVVDEALCDGVRFAAKAWVALQQFAATPRRILRRPGVPTCFSLVSAALFRLLRSAHPDACLSRRSSISPRDPNFAQKAGRVLDLYHAVWAGRPLGNRDYVICSDEKTSSQARARVVAGMPPGRRRLRRVEHEYERRGALAYIAASEVGRAKLSCRCESTTGIEPFHRLVDLVMTQEPYRSARRVF